MGGGEVCGDVCADVALSLGEGVGQGRVEGVGELTGDVGAGGGGEGAGCVSSLDERGLDDEGFVDAHAVAGAAPVAVGVGLVDHAQRFVGGGELVAFADGGWEWVGDVGGGELTKDGGDGAFDAPGGDACGGGVDGDGAVGYVDGVVGGGGVDSDNDVVGVGELAFASVVAHCSGEEGDSTGLEFTFVDA